MDTNFINKLILQLTFFLMQSALGITSADIPAAIPSYDPARISIDRTITQNPDFVALQEEIANKGSIIIPKSIMQGQKTQEKKIETKPKITPIVTPKFKLNDVIINGVTIYNKKEFYKIYQPYLNKDVSTCDLQNIADLIIARYHQDGYTLSQADLSIQKITPEEVVARIQVIEG